MDAIFTINIGFSRLMAWNGRERETLQLFIRKQIE